jgi:hypothetical protein
MLKAVCTAVCTAAQYSQQQFATHSRYYAVYLPYEFSGLWQMLQYYRASVYLLLHCVRVDICNAVTLCLRNTQVHSGESDFTPPRFKPAPDVYLR